MPISGVSSHIYYQAGVAGSAPGEHNDNPQNTNRELTDEEKAAVEKLQVLDKKVRAHERAHVAAGGGYIRGGASFEYQTGPDGKKYAVGGEVSIDTSPVKGDPQATIQKMQVVRKAALAPADPSATDRAVAAKATQQETRARMELREEKQGKAEEKETAGASGVKGTRISSYTSSGELVPAAASTSTGILDLIA